MVWYSQLFKNFPLFLVIHTVNGFRVVNEEEVDVFLKCLCFLHDPTNAANLISGSSVFSKSSLNIWKFSVHILLKPSLKDFEHSLASIGIGMKLMFSSPVVIAQFSKSVDILNAAL